MNNSQFQEIKRTLLAGSIIAVLLMGASFFGVFDAPESEETVLSPSETIVWLIGAEAESLKRSGLLSQNCPF